MQIRTFLALAAFFFCAKAALSEYKPARDAQDFGVMLLSHGGSNQWNDLVMGVRNALAGKFPIEVAFGMADPIAIQKAADDLTAQHVKKIIAVPLFVSSHSEVMEQTKYVLGIRKDPSKEFVDAPHAHMGHVTIKRAAIKVPIVLATALDDHSVVAAILLDRAREMSRDPEKESVVLVGHGPLKDGENELWLGTMANLARIIKRDGRFAAVECATLRDDSPLPVRQEADRKLREMVKGLSLRTKVLVIPDLIAQGGIERHIVSALNGCFYEWTGKTLLPDPRIAQWIEESAKKNLNEPDMRKYKDEGHIIPGSDRQRLQPLEPMTGSHHHE